VSKDPIEAAFAAKQIDETERDELTAFQAEHRRVKFWRLDSYGLYVIRRPQPHEAKVYYKQGADERFDKFTLGYEYVKTCTLRPKLPAECDEIFKDYPLFPGVVLAALSELAGSGFEELGKV
jgi:hypothetical protein